jgi:hypothetical protein
MTFWVLRNWQGLALATVLALPAGYVKGRLDGREAGRVGQLEATVKAQGVRGEVNHEVSRMGYPDLCAALGGLPDDCAKLRRLEQATKAGQSGSAGRQ